MHALDAPPRGGGAVLLGIIGGGLPPSSPDPDPISDQTNVIFHTEQSSKIHSFFRLGSRFLKFSIINGPAKLFWLTCTIEVSIVLHLT